MWRWLAIIALVLTWASPGLGQDSGTDAGAGTDTDTDAGTDAGTNIITNVVSNCCWIKWIILRNSCFNFTN